MKRATATRPSGYERFMAMSEAEKEAVYEECERLGPDDFGPMTPEARRRWEKAKRRGRPVKGQGHKVISVSVEKGLLARTDALARKQKVSRAALIARGLEAVLKGVA